MTPYFFILLFSLFVLIALLGRKHFDLNRGVSTRASVFFERLDSVLLFYVTAFFKIVGKVQKILNIGGLFHASTIFLVGLSNVYEKMKKMVIARTVPLVEKLRGKKEMGKDNASVYVRDMLDYKSNLSR